MSASVTIVGGGIAGAAAAIHLARAGRPPLLIERSAGAHHKVCGEFLSVETVAGLRALGIEPLALGAARIDRVRLAHGRQRAEARLPFAALSLSRRRLDEALLAQAQRAGARIERGRALARSDAAGGGALFVATGKHALRGIARPRGGGLIGLKGYFRLAPAQAAALAGAVELILHPGGYAGLQLVEDNIANLCLLAPRGDASGLAAIIARTPHLARRLAGAEPLLAQPLAIANLPYGWTHAPSAEDPPTHWRLGDQWGMIPSFTGDGMALALATASLATRAWLEGAPAAAYHAQAQRRLRPGVALAQRLARLGLVPALAAPMLAACRAAPALMRWVASATRAPDLGPNPPAR